MIAAWMLHAVAVAALVFAAGVALDRLLRPHRRPLRRVWLGVLALGAGLPLYQLLGGGSPASADALSGTAPVVALEAIRPTVGADSVLRSLDPLLLVAWALLSVTLLVLICRAALRTRQLRRGWEGRRIAGEDVLIAPDVGPAVVGLLRPAVVVPGWMLEAEPEALELAVLHEREHIRTGDPRTVALGAALLLLAPWNIPLWWAFRRLREAVAVDCDARVLARRPGALRSYAKVLLEVGRHRADPVAGLAPALTQPRSFLQRRIRTMTSSPPSRPVIRAVALGSVALLSLAGACIAPDAREGGEASLFELDATSEQDVITVEVPPDAAVSRDEASRSAISRGEAAGSAIPDPPSEPVRTRLTHAPDIKNSSEVVKALQDQYPPLLRKAGIEGTALVWMYVDETGTIRDARIRESAGHEALDRAAVDVARVFDFTAPRNEEGAVAAWIALPITFTRD